MLRTAQRTYSRFDAISRLNQEEHVSGKIIPSRVRTMFSIPIVVLPGLDAPALPLDLAAGIGTFFRPTRFFIWKPAGSAYVGTPGNLQLRFSTGTPDINTPYTAILTSNNANVLSFLDSGLYTASGPEKYDLRFGTGDVTGDGPPLYYTIFYTRYPLTCPLQLS